jgi:hypothetical protein
MARIEFSFRVCVAGVSAELEEFFKHGDPIVDRSTLVSCLQKIALSVIEESDIRIEDYDVDTVISKLNAEMRDKAADDAGF